jgi:hypothetical protein
LGQKPTLSGDKRTVRFRAKRTWTPANELSIRFWN